MAQDHHYIPAFYLRRWTDDGGRLYGFCRPHKKLIGKQYAPERIGFETDLYTFPEAGPTGESYLEDQFRTRPRPRSIGRPQAHRNNAVQTRGRTP